jgi:Ca2+-binding RTX toxin-like protein
MTIRSFEIGTQNDDEQRVSDSEISMAMLATTHNWTGLVNQSIAYVVGDVIMISSIASTSLSFSSAAGTLLLSTGSATLTMNSATAVEGDLADLTFEFFDGSRLLYTTGTAGGVGVSLYMIGSAHDNHFIGSSQNDKLDGGAGNDTLSGAAGNDTINGGLGNDIIDGDAGSDSMSGGDGSDAYYVRDAGDVVIETNAAAAGGANDVVISYVANYTLGANVEEGRLMLATAANLTGNALNNFLMAGKGANVINGGAGIDMVSYYLGATSGVTVSLAVAGVQVTGGSGSDTLVSIEGLIGSNFSDKLTGNSGDNHMEADMGDDTLDGGFGNDLMSGGDGADTYLVHDAGDWVIETYVSTADSQNDQVLSYLAAYTLGNNVETGRIMNATAANLTGNAHGNVLYAGNGDNVLDGAAGTDTVSYAYGATSGLTLSLALAGAQLTGGSGSDTLIGIENIIGSAFADKLTGNSGANALRSGNGNDSLYGGSGNDTMIGSDGADTYSVQDLGDVVIETTVSSSSLESDYVFSYVSSFTLGANIEQARIMSIGVAGLTGGSTDNVLFAATGDNALDGAGGIDTVSYTYGASAGVTVSLSVAGAQATGGSGSDTLNNVENLDGSAYADYLTGSVVANILNGAAGNDTLDSGAGNDTLDGGAGIDSMSGGDGVDSYYVRDLGDVVVETNATVGAAQMDTVYSYVGAFTLGANIEQARIMVNTAAGLTGNAMDNVLWAGFGANALDGAGGLDTVSYADGATGGVTVSLALAGVQATGGSGSDTLASIEHLVGSAFADRLTGNSGANALTGSAGNDTLDGGSGIDTMSGGDGADTYIVQDVGDAVLEVNASTSPLEADIVWSYLADYTLHAYLENGRAMGAANMTGNARDNILYAGIGSNVLSGDTGIDTASYIYGATAGVTLSLAVAGAQASGGSGSDTLVDIEHLVGSAYADRLTGSSGANSLGGGAGNDSLYGGLGIDTMSGGDGSDTYSVQDVGDVIVETRVSGAAAESDFVFSYLANYTLTAHVEQGRIMNAFAANLTGNAQDNILFAGAGNNVLTGAAGSDTVSYVYGASAVTVDLSLAAAQATGGSGSDTLSSIENLVGTNSADQLTGDASANALSGGAGNDTLSGGLGNDTLTGGAGVDLLTGGTGNDIFVYTLASDTGAAVGTRDTITDFVVGQDKIDLSLIDANTATVGNDAFTTMIGSAEVFTAAGQLRVTAGVLYVNTDADADAEFAITLTGAPALTIGDFIP